MIEARADDDSLRRAVLDGRHASAVALHHALALEAAESFVHRESRKLQHKHVKNPLNAECKSVQNKQISRERQEQPPQTGRGRA